MSSELLIGLVGAVGSDLATVTDHFASELRRVNFEAVPIRLSAELLKLGAYSRIVNPVEEYERIDNLMTAGDSFRAVAQRGDAMALLGMAKIRATRTAAAAREQGDAPAAIRHGYIIHSLKRREEIRTFREVYGKNFIVVSVFSTISQRRKALCERIAKSRNSYSPDDFKDEASKLIDRDRKEAGRPLGQDLEATFPEADFFLDARDASELGRQIARFIQLLFSHPYVTPTVDELGMFQAKAASLRSADLSRQVGAVVTTREGEVLSTGCNEVPRGGGGVNWEDVFNTDQDYRDFKVGYDATIKMKHQILAEIFVKLKPWLADSVTDLKAEDLVARALYDGTDPPLKGSRADSLLEFGRIVHAEMAAITDAAKRGVAINKARLYCTTFPCHMCARHILASGINEVVYIEPYPKSLAKDLYPNMICVDDEAVDDDAVVFRPFVGVAPRVFIELFQAGERKDRKGRSIKWDQGAAELKISQRIDAETEEKGFLAELNRICEKLERTDLFDVAKEDSNGR